MTKIFNTPFETELRVVEIDGEPWFVAKDVLQVLGIAWSGSPLRKLREHEKGTHPMPTPGGPQNMAIISEAGFNRLIMRSDKPEADAFQDWVVSEVLPSIRKTGQYVTTEKAKSLREQLATPQGAAEIMWELTGLLQEREAKIEELKPHAAAGLGAQEQYSITLTEWFRLHLGRVVIGRQVQGPTDATLVRVGALARVSTYRGTKLVKGRNWDEWSSYLHETLTTNGTAYQIKTRTEAELWDRVSAA